MNKERAALEILTTSRLTLKPLNTSVANDIFNNFTKEVTRYMFPTPAKTIEETLNFIRAMQNSRAKLTDFVYSIHLKDTDEFIGCAGLHGLASDIPELGIWTKVSAHGHKYGLEAITALVKLAQNLDYDTLKYPVDCHNIASKRIPLALGGELISEHKMIKTPDGRTLDEEVYHINIATQK